MEFTPRPKLDRACGAITGWTLSGNVSGDFKEMLDKIAIYVGVNYGHRVGMALKSRKEAIIHQPEDPKTDKYESTKYIWQIKYKY